MFHCIAAPTPALTNNDYSQGVSTKLPLRGGLPKPGNMTTWNDGQGMKTMDDGHAGRETPAVHMAFLGGDGTILRVSSGWKTFAKVWKLQMPGFGIGSNYLDHCTEPKRKAEIKALLRDRTDMVSYIYPCETARKKLWFVAIGLPCRDEEDVRAVIMHVEITPWMPRGGDMKLSGAAPGAELSNLLLGLQQSMKIAVAEGMVAASRSESDLAGGGERTLTPRQEEVLEWIANGKTNQEIAELLGCSLNTVKRHVSAVLLRLNLSSRTKAALYAKNAAGLEPRAVLTPHKVLRLQRSR
jgi:DNA-binding CsgD family transcriptional regulator